jgi:hypothetical protein
MNEPLTAPMFRVFQNSLDSPRPWVVCGTNLEGEPTSVEAEYRSLRQAIAQAARANELYAGIKSQE